MEYSSTPALSEESMSIFEEMKNRLSTFERRLRAVEHPGKIVRFMYDGDTKGHSCFCSLADQPERGGLGGLC